MNHRCVRTLVRGCAATSVVGIALMAGPAFADTPTDWVKAPPVTPLDWLLVLLLIPLGLAVLITTVVLVATRGDSYEPGQAWIGQDEWFGGPSPSAGPGQLGSGESDQTGGASASF